MKKLLLGLAVAVLSLSGVSASVGATDDATISNTGPGSSNVIETKEDFKCEVKNENDFKITNNNTQEATSGSATVTGNTTGGSATSGSATNSNGTVIEVEVTNTGCVVTAVTPPAPVLPVGGIGAGPVAPAGQQRPVGGMGAVAPVAAPQRTAPTVLPDTSAESALGVITTLIILLGATAVGSRFAVEAYSNLKS